MVAPALLTRISSPPNSRPHLVDELLRRALLAQIEHGDAGAAAGFADRVGDLIERRRIAAGQHHVAAFGRQSQRDAAADAAARSGHQRDLSLQSHFHFLIRLLIFDFQAELLDERGPFAFLALDILRIFVGRRGRRIAAGGDEAFLDVVGARASRAAPC